MTGIRRAVAADQPGVTRVVTAAFRPYVDRVGRPPAPMTADYIAVIARSRVWVVDDAGIAAVLVAEDRGDHLYIDTVAVAPERQGCGYGKQLLSWAESDARGLGLPELRLVTNEAMTENLTFYPRRGFVETGRGQQDGYHRVFFTKVVAPEPS